MAETEVIQSETSDDADDEDVFEGVLFELNGEPYMITVRDAASIVAMSDVTRVPRSSDPVDGVVDLRGEITVVLNPQELLNLDGEDPPQHKQRIIILDPYVDSQRIGIRVDSVSGVQSFPDSRLDEHGSANGFSTPGLESGLLDAVIHPEEDDDHQIIGVLDVDAIIEASTRELDQ